MYGKNAHITNKAEKGEARPTKMHSFLAKRKHLGKRTKLTILMKVSIPPLVYTGEVWEGNTGKEAAFEAAEIQAARTCTRVLQAHIHGTLQRELS